MSKRDQIIANLVSILHYLDCISYGNITSRIMINCQAIGAGISTDRFLLSAVQFSCYSSMISRFQGCSVSSCPFCTAFMPPVSSVPSAGQEIFCSLAE